MDDLDKTNRDMEALMKATLSTISQVANKREVQSTGYCLHCGSIITQTGRRWCNAECRDAWEEDNRKHHKTGVRH